MITLILGTPDSGKSMLAEKMAMERAEGDMIYLATMIAYDEMRKVMKNRDILDEARLLPPQIADLSMRFEGFEEVYTHFEMLQKLRETVKG